MDRFSRRRVVAAGKVLAFAVLALASKFPISALPEQGGPEGVTATPYTGIVSGNLNANQNPLYGYFGAALGYTSTYFDASASAMTLNDGLYSQEEAIPGGFRIRLNNGDVALRAKPFSVKGGLMAAHDEVRSPYSLFFSSEDNPTTSLDLGFARGAFFYKSEWLQLNLQSANGYPDRGMNYKVYGLQLGRLRIGFQDVVLYLDKSFSAEYLLSPIPMYLTQLVNVQGSGNPWVQISNENTLMGFFGDYTAPKWYGYAQLLLDDVSLGFLAPQMHILHPWKIAWSLGGTYTFPFGTLGFYQAGASKYTFEATYQSGAVNTYPYQYTYYPAVSHTLSNGTVLPIPYEQNYIGYKYGENNLAFLATYTNRFGRYDVGGNLEYRISGSKSPDNPWQNLTTAPYKGWELLDESPLEQRILLAGYAQRAFGSLTVSVGATIGYVSHELQLTPATDGGADILAPSSTSRFLYQLDLGLSYKLAMSTSKRSK